MLWYTYRMPNRVPISATDITNCLRGIVFKRQNKVAPPLHPDIMKTLDLFRTFGDTGQAIQRTITNFWRKKGVLVSAGDPIASTDGFSGRFDALCQIHGKLVLYEVKGVSQTFFDWVKEHRVARPYNKIQLMIYHKALRDEYPELEPRLLYVSRNQYTKGTLTSVEIPISYSDDEFQRVCANAEHVQSALTGGELPAAAPAIETDPQTGERVISMNAITCRHHALCLENGHWYEDAKKELGQALSSSEDEQTSVPVPSEDELPF